ncbi:MAG: HD domain-containing protein [Hyphomicrobiales bacterium]|nr:HD domain-containing protein [Hyphomicrobiales bacterium]
MLSGVHVVVLGENEHLPEDLRRSLTGIISVRHIRIKAREVVDIGNGTVVIIDADRAASFSPDDIADLVQNQIRPARPLIFVGQAKSRAPLAAHNLLRFGSFMFRPFSTASLLDIVQFLSSQPRAVEPVPAGEASPTWIVDEHALAMSAGETVLAELFSFAKGQSRLNQPDLIKTGDLLIGSLAESGLNSWVHGVRQHHDRTYQHCLLVAGLAVGFGLKLQFRQSDLQLVAKGALLHDIGKARVPLDILDKPGKLTDAESAMMQKHPVYGEEAMRLEAGVEPAVLRVMRSHHEFLDGSGYPDGLVGESIDDLVRLTTIADIVAALIEQRPYKAPLSGEEAFEVLAAMHGKLDMPIVKALSPLGRLI